MVLDYKQIKAGFKIELGIKYCKKSFCKKLPCTNDVLRSWMKLENQKCIYTNTTTHSTQYTYTQTYTYTFDEDDDDICNNHVRYNKMKKGKKERKKEWNNNNLLNKLNLLWIYWARTSLEKIQLSTGFNGGWKSRTFFYFNRIWKLKRGPQFENFEKCRRFQ